MSILVEIAIRVVVVLIVLSVLAAWERNKSRIRYWRYRDDS